MLPARLPKKPKRASRWRSRAHCDFVRGHACSAFCGSGEPIEVAHVRNGSAAGIGQKPDDWRVVSLCRACHAKQHRVGEQTFWKGVKIDPELMIAAFIKASPRRVQIEQAMKERKLNVEDVPELETKVMPK